MKCEEILRNEILSMELGPNKSWFLKSSILIFFPEMIRLGDQCRWKPGQRIPFLY